MFFFNLLFISLKFCLKFENSRIFERHLLDNTSTFNWLYAIRYTHNPEKLLAFLQSNCTIFVTFQNNVWKFEEN